MTLKLPKHSCSVTSQLYICSVRSLKTLMPLKLDPSQLKWDLVMPLLCCSLFSLLVRKLYLRICASSTTSSATSVFPNQSTDHQSLEGQLWHEEARSSASTKVTASTQRHSTEQAMVRSAVVLCALLSSLGYSLHSSNPLLVSMDALWPINVQMLLFANV